jgi:hypothetical protein
MLSGCPTKKIRKETEGKTMDTTARALKAIADGGEKKGLLKFFCKETEDEHKQRMRREGEEHDLQQQKVAEEAILKAEQEAAAKESKRFEAKMRKRKSRGQIYDHERAAGLRDNNLRLKRRKVSKVLTVKLLNHSISQVIDANLHYYTNTTNIATMS